MTIIYIVVVDDINTFAKKEKVLKCGLLLTITIHMKYISKFTRNNNNNNNNNTDGHNLYELYSKVSYLQLGTLITN